MTRKKAEEGRLQFNGFKNENSLQKSFIFLAISNYKGQVKSTLLHNMQSVVFVWGFQVVLVNHLPQGQLLSFQFASSVWVSYQVCLSQKELKLFL